MLSYFFSHLNRLHEILSYSSPPPSPPRVSILIPIIEFSSFLKQHKNILSASEKFLVCYVRFFPVFLVLLIFIEFCFPLQFR